MREQGDFVGRVSVIAAERILSDGLIEAQSGRSG